MKETAASTAYGPMVMVALEGTFPREQRIIDDALAYSILPPYMKGMVKVCAVKPIRDLMLRLIDKSTPGLTYAFACRKRYITDTVRTALAEGFDSVVILGAGLDTLAYRMPELAALPVYEVDLPENVAYKRKKLEACLGSIPAQVTLVPVDFETQKLDAALQLAGYTFGQKTLFVWEAVTQYLTESAVRETFQVLAKAGTGSRLLFTYVVQDFLTGANKYGLDSLYKRMIGNNRIWYFGLQPAAVSDFIGKYGWSLLEDIGGDELADRYLKPIGRMEAIAPLERIAYAKKM